MWIHASVQRIPIVMLWITLLFAHAAMAIKGTHMDAIVHLVSLITFSNCYCLNCYSCYKIKLLIKHNKLTSLFYILVMPVFDCEDDDDCNSNEECINQDCIDPCVTPTGKTRACSHPATCFVYNHKPMCRCPPGYDENLSGGCILGIY